MCQVASNFFPLNAQCTELQELTSNKEIETIICYWWW
jgi:hypothetical protein